MTLWSPTFVAILNTFALQNLTEALIAGLAGCFPLGCCRRWGEWSWSTILMQQEGCFSEAKPWGWLSDSCQSAKGKQNKTKTSTTKMSVEPWVCVGCASAASSSSKVTSTPFIFYLKNNNESFGCLKRTLQAFVFDALLLVPGACSGFLSGFYFEKKREEIFSLLRRDLEKN